MADTKKYYWLKLKEDFFKDKEIKKLRRIAGGDTYTIIYLKLMLLGLRDEGKLCFDGIEDSFAEELALELDEDADNVKMTLMFLLKVGLIQEVSESELFLTRLPECVGKETSKAELMRKKRERDKIEASNNVTPPLLPVTECYTEKEKEKEKEEDTEKREKRKIFRAPTVEEVKEYCAERKNNVDAEQFVDYYSAKGWIVGKSPMKDWKASVRTWERNGFNDSKKKTVGATGVAINTPAEDDLAGIF